MIDIVEIKVAKYLKFYEKNNFIYCENIVTGERVIVEETKVEPDIKETIKMYAPDGSLIKKHIKEIIGDDK